MVSIVEYDQGLRVKEKLKKIYFLHTDLEGLYYLLFKAMFEIKLTHPSLSHRSALSNMADQ
ncbi:hypothetical protein J599_1038 [Acinetobacter baumannii 1598530]|nr:hypothetical protein J599_1038 [Acinetobacter baumannii 1598530]